MLAAEREILPSRFAAESLSFQSIALTETLHAVLTACSSIWQFQMGVLPFGSQMTAWLEYRQSRAVHKARICRRHPDRSRPCYRGHTNVATCSLRHNWCHG